MFSHLMEDQCEFIRIFLIQFNEFLIKKIQIPDKKCNLSDYKWQFLLLLTYLYPYLGTYLCILSNSWLMWIVVQQCRSTVVLSQKKVVHKSFPQIRLCLFVYFFPKKTTRYLVDTNTVAVHIAYYILQVGFHSRVVPRRKRRDQNSFCNQNKLTLVVRCFGRLCIVHMSMLKDTTSANYGHTHST